MTLLKQLLLGVIGLAAGGTIAAGVYAFLAIIGVFVRLIGKTGTKRRILLYETVIVLGGILGNLMDLFWIRVPMGDVIGLLFLGTGGLCVGVFVGCLIMSLAETLNALPVLSRRLRLKTGLPYVILGIAAGKCAGAVFYFFR